MPGEGNSPRSLPDYDNPPVVETVLGVEFPPLQGWDVRHFGLYWARVRERFATLETKPAIARSGAGEGVPFTFVLEQLRDPAADVRCWFIDQDETKLLQIQQDRLVHNWRKVRGDESYPHYEETVRPRFLAELEEFLLFLKEEGIPAPAWGRCEVTYINHLEWGREWHSLQDLPDILPAWRSGALSGPELSPPDSVNLRWRQRLDPDEGWLTFVLQSATRQRDQKKVLQYQISAQVDAPDGATMESLPQALDRGRCAVVRSFDLSTSPKMHSLWGRKERSA